jgi:ABC-type sugar transport system ATPase subunit
MTIRNKISKMGFIRNSLKNKICLEYIDKLNINPKDPNRELKYFSGGNQQKAVLSKWLVTDPRILLLDEPTRGIDVGAKKEIYHLIHQLADSGISILFISSEIEEVLGVCDRLLVMREGEITGEFLKGQATQEDVMKIAAS